MRAAREAQSCKAARESQEEDERWRGKRSEGKTRISSRGLWKEGNEGQRRKVKEKRRKRSKIQKQRKVDGGKK